MDRFSCGLAACLPGCVVRFIFSLLPLLHNSIIYCNYRCFTTMHCSTVAAVLTLRLLISDLLSCGFPLSKPKLARLLYAGLTEHQQVRASWDFDGQFWRWKTRRMFLWLQGRIASEQRKFSGCQKTVLPVKWHWKRVKVPQSQAWIFRGGIPNVSVSLSALIIALVDIVILTCKTCARNQISKQFDTSQIECKPLAWLIFIQAFGRREFRKSRRDFLRAISAPIIIIRPSIDLSISLSPSIRLSPRSGPAR